MNWGTFSLVPQIGLLPCLSPLVHADFGTDIVCCGSPTSLHRSQTLNLGQIGWRLLERTLCAAQANVLHRLACLTEGQGALGSPGCGSGSHGACQRLAADTQCQMGCATLPAN